MTRPQSIIAFERFYLGAMALGLVNAVLSWNQTQDMMASPEVAAAGLGNGFLLTTMAFSFAIPLLLWYFIAWRASNVAKWILVVMFALGLVVMLLSLANPMMPDGLALVFTFVVTALQGYAIYMLFRPDAVAWLAGSAPVDPDVFN